MNFSIVQNSRVNIPTEGTSRPDTDSSPEPQDAFLRLNSEVYERLVAGIHAMDLRKDTEEVLRSVAFAAHFACEHHSGRFADGMIENILLEIGSRLDNGAHGGEGRLHTVGRPDSRRRILHVATMVFGIGGHTRTLYHWVRNDRESRHSLVLLDQGDIPVPAWLTGAVRDSGGAVTVFSRTDGIDGKAGRLRATAQANADLVILHHSASDVVPTVAFAASDCPPVAVHNHGGHQFWLGSSVTDLVINLQTTAAEHTRMRRFVAFNMVLPIPLTSPQRQVSRREARRTLGIPAGQIVLLSIGRDVKYRPFGPYDFTATAGKILDLQPDAHLYVVGESAAGIAPHLRREAHDRLHFAGIIEDPSLYLTAADVYLESFPFGSVTALLEAALGGLPAVPAYAPLFPLLVANDDSVKDLLPNPRNEEEYVTRALVLMDGSAHRRELGEKLRTRVAAEHVGSGWMERLHSVYRETDRLTHAPRPIPAASCSVDKEDIGLSLWHAMDDGKSRALRIPGNAASDVLCHAAYVQKYVGDYATARRSAWRAVRNDPRRRRSWRLLAAAVLGRPGRYLWRILR